MTLVDYPSSSDSEDNDNSNEPPGERESSRTGTDTYSQSGVEPTLKRKRSHTQVSESKESSNAKSELPPLPSSFHDLYASAARASTQDDPGLHGGRKRSVPHIEGNWPSHVYLEWYPSPKESSLLAQVINHVGQHLPLHSLLQSDLGTPRPLHISLSQSLNLETEQRQQFLTELISHLHAPASSKSASLRDSKVESNLPNQHVGPFTTHFSSLHWFPNRSNDRWFLVLRVLRPANDELCRLLQACNQVVKAFGQRELYPEKQNERAKQDTDSRSETFDGGRSELGDLGESFHVSIAWSLEPPSHETLQFLQSSSAPLDTGVKLEKVLAGIRKLDLYFDSVKVKIGNAVQSVELSDKVRDQPRGIIR